MLGGVRSSAFFSGKLFFYDIVTVFSESNNRQEPQRYVLRRASEGEGRAAHASYQEAGKHRALRRRANIAT